MTDLNQTNPTESLNNESLIMTKDTLGSLDRIIYWAKFLSILGFIGVAFMLIGALSIALVGNSIMGSEVAGISVVYLVFAAIYFMPMYYLFKFATHARQGLTHKSQYETDQGLIYLAAHYKFIGIMAIVLLSLYVLIFIGVFAAGIGLATGAGL
ncbi:MAG: hypothetical protein EBT51_01820 [Flavobacteriaceae bacterium]|jgi:hypothetical protein|nr:hypothetical protein [Flavobacteriaceae bacterium]MDB2463268.1 hypothetical protein [Flavobacteriaceae bacterium]MDB2586455.1 hypothetical protein [Flavobacteriaceae bacterium]NBT87030.1 hypothetical protein [Flavobacteriaceae bacterium]